MAGELFESAVLNRELVRDVADAVDRVAASRNLLVREAPGLVRLAAQDHLFRDALARALGEVAERHRLSFTPTVSAAPEKASGELEAFINSNPTQQAPDWPIVMMFVAAALIFAPSVFSATGGTMFGIAEFVNGVEGIEPFS